eukprot:440140-Prorocentrum_minimum.AAC.1
MAIVFTRSSGFGPPEPEDRNLEPLDRAKIIAVRYLVALLFPIRSRYFVFYGSSCATNGKDALHTLEGRLFAYLRSQFK